MSALTCIIDFSGKGIQSQLDKGQKSIAATDNYLLLASDDYHGKYVFSESDSKFILIIGTAFIKGATVNESHLVKSKSQLQDIQKHLDEGRMPEKLLTGFYNLISVDKIKKEAVLHTSHFGMRPIFYSVNKEACIISTNPEGVVKTGLIKGKLEFSTALQFFMFNYPVNEDTMFKDVYSLPAGSRLMITAKDAKIETYFDPLSLINKPEYTYKESNKLLSESLDNVIKKYSLDIKSFSLSLTGGWDGRLILALMHGKNLEVSGYSHGGPNNPDVLIPGGISKQLGVNYTPYVLNKEYYDNKFFDYAKRIVDNSSGTRSVTRTHYLYSVGSEMLKNDYVLTGICGSNLMKGNVVPGPVTNAMVLKLIFESDFDIFWAAVEEIYKNKVEHLIPIQKEVLDELKVKMKEVHTNLHRIEKLETRLYKFILGMAERRYFGTEIMTYSNVGENLAPFIDIDFVEALSKTPYFGAYVQINDKNIFANWRNSLLYADIINSAYPELGKIPSDKGISLYDLSKKYRWPWIAMQQVKKRFKSNKVEYYNHSSGIDEVISSIQANPLIKPDINLMEQYNNDEVTNNIYSFLFWGKDRGSYL